MKKLSLYDLTYGYLKSYYNGDPSKAPKRSIMNDLKRKLKEGWTAEDMIKVFKKHKGEGHERMMYWMNRSPKRNLLNPETFYWHPQLRITPGAPVRKIDYNTGEITKVQEEHFLEMRASYTIEDLMEYWEKQHGEIDNSKKNKFKGAFNYLLNNHSIDTVLFMIDASSNFVKAEDLMPLSSPLDMDNYEREARNVMGEKMTEEIQAGDDNIVPRRRVPLHRGRSKTKTGV